MKKIIYRALALLMIFIAAISAYWYFGQNGKKTQERVFSGIEERKLPGVWIHSLDRRMNYMHPYTTAPGINVTFDTLTILPKDRKLNLTVEKTGPEIRSISYEVRTADLAELIERTEITDYSEESDSTSLVLPLQNLLKEGQEYRLDLSIAFGNDRVAHYYSKIMFGNEELAKAMVDLATSFSEKNFDYESARENTTFLESNSTGDNSSLAKVNLKSSYDMLTYNRLRLEQVGEKDVRLTGFDGHMGEISIRSTVRRALSDTRYELYDIFESFTLRQGPERLYMMDYTRTMHEWFLGNPDSVTGDRILLGISDAEATSSKSSQSLRFEAFVSNRDLFLLDTKEANIKKIFSFRSDSNPGMASNNYKYDVKILRVNDGGDVEFMIFGHMQSGEHEGELGIAVHHFDFAENAVVERSFIPVSSTYEEIKQGVDTLAHLGENQILYLKIANSVYGFDIHTNDYVLVAGDLKDDRMGVSHLGTGFAWQGSNEAQGSEVIYYMNLETGEKKQIGAAVNELLRVEGFVAADMIVSAVDRNGVWMNNNKTMPPPAKLIRIIDSGLNVIKEYERSPYYLNHIYIEEDRVHMDLLSKSKENTFVTDGKDTIVSTVEEKAENYDSIDYYATDEKTRVYYVQVHNSLEKVIDGIEVTNRISYEQSAIINVPVSQSSGKYIAIGQGKLLGGFDDIQTAISRAYEKMGSVFQDGRLLYLRADTSSARNLKLSDIDIQKILEDRENDKLLDLRGITLKQALYYVSNYMPVLAYSDAGTPLIIYGYDRTQVTVYDTSSNQSVRLAMEDAVRMFEKSYNDFSTSFTFP